MQNITNRTSIYHPQGNQQHFYQPSENWTTRWENQQKHKIINDALRLISSANFIVLCSDLICTLIFLLITLTSSTHNEGIHKIITLTGLVFLLRFIYALIYIIFLFLQNTQDEETNVLQKIGKKMQEQANNCYFCIQSTQLLNNNYLNVQPQLNWQRNIVRDEKNLLKRIIWSFNVIMVALKISFQVPMQFPNFYVRKAMFQIPCLLLTIFLIQKVERITDFPNQTAIIMFLTIQILFGSVFALIFSIHIIRIIGKYLIRIIQCLFKNDQHQKQDQQPQLVEIISAQQIQSRLSEENSSTQNQQQCSICLQRLRNGKRISSLQCFEKHQFHEVCIYQWALTKPNCPVCRQRITGISISQE